MPALGALRALLLCVILALSSTTFAACPCTIFGNNGVPGAQSPGETAVAELGITFSSSVDGYVTGVRFFKLVGNTGPHLGDLWSANGTLLASAPFTVETDTGWQQVNFATPVPITANTNYVASYHTNTGNYAFDYNYFTTNAYSNPPLLAPVNAGVGTYAGPGSTFPTNPYYGTNYWVDVVFTTSPGPDTTPPTVVSTSPGPGGTGASLQPTVSAILSEPLNASSISNSSFFLLSPSGTQIAATPSYSPSSRTATLVPTSPLTSSTTYTAVLKSSVSDTSGNALGSDYSWKFTTVATFNQGPGGPILLLTSSSSPYSLYYAEILRTEGFNEFAVLDVSQLNSALLTQYQIVIVGDFALSASAVNILTNWVNSGGFLIAMHPDKQLAGLLGLTDAGATLANAYLRVNTSAGPGAGIVGVPIQFHGSADLYTLNGATAIATLYSNLTTSTGKPAVTLRAVGNGATAAFTYDLAKSVVMTRQGNPAWSGQTRDGLSPRRSDDLFYGAASFDPQPDWVDFTNIAIPQADEQQRLLGNLMLSLAYFDQPLPRFWYFPHGVPAVVIMTGDDHANGGTTGRFDIQIANSPAGCSVDDWQCVRSTSYAYPDPRITQAQLAYYTSLGFEISVHVLNGCVDYTSFADIDRWYANMLSQFFTAYPGGPAPSTERTHCVAFSDYDTQPKVQVARQIRLDSNYYFNPPSWVQNRPGFFTGSGMPMRFTALDGSMIDVYQAPTQMTDESGQSYPDTVISLLNFATGPQGFYAAFNTNMHTDTAAHAAADTIVSTAQAHGVPLVSALQMLRWLDGRNTSSFNSFNWNGYILAFTENSGPNTNGIMAMLPSLNAVGTLSGITVNGTSVAYSTQTIKGVSYAMFNAVSGGNYQATYSGLSSITFSPSSVGGGNSSTGTVTLNGPAPASGAKVNLMSGSGIATVPAFVNVLAGATTATFIATTQSVSSTTPVTITGSYGGVTVTGTLTVTTGGGQPTLTSIAVTPANPTISVGGTQPFTATGTYSDSSTQNLTSQVTWASSKTSVATISAAGVATGTATGTSTISAKLGSITGSTVLTVSPATLVSIAVTPANPSIAAGNTQPFTATGTYSDTSTQNITSQVTWASDNAGVATINSSGTATGKTVGSANISATLGSVSGGTKLTVTAATLFSIAVTPANPSIAVGGTQPFTATGTYTDSSTQNLTAQVTWASSKTTVATITTGGVASGKATGTSTISATLGSVTGSTVLTITAATLVSIAVTPANPSIAAGNTQPFTATGTYSDTSTQNLTPQVTWGSSKITVATITAAGVATGKATGTSTISATLGSVTGSTVLTVTPALLVSIAVTPANPIISAGSTLPFTATGTYTDSSTQNITSTVTWSSSTMSVATINTAGLATAVALGSTTIKAVSGSISGTTTLTVGNAGISFANGFTSNGLALNGSATINTNASPDRLRLTSRTTNQAGSAWFTTPQNIQTFTNDFSFTLSSGSSIADGFTFVIQNAGTSALGPSGGGLGYGPGTAGGSASNSIKTSVAVKFDLYSNSGEGTNSTGLYTNGASPTTPATSLGSAIDLHSGHVMNVHMTYVGTTLTMTITDVATAKTFTTSWTVNIPSVVGGNTAYVGFTGGTGGQTAIQEILTWDFSNTVPTPVTYQTSKLVVSTSGPSVQSLSYSGFPDGTGTLFNSTKANDRATFTVNVATPGTYDVQVSYRAANSYGIWQLAINGSNVGPLVDEYQSSTAYAVADLGTFNFSSAGSYSFRFTVGKKNASSSGFKISFDDFILTPQ